MSIRRHLVAPIALLLLGGAPLSGQVNIGLHIDIPILGRSLPRPPVVVRRPGPPPRVFVVRDYSARRFGEWRREAHRWTPVVVWYHEGRYFEREVPRSRRVVIYHYRGEYFRDPGDRAWREYRDRELRWDTDYRPRWRVVDTRPVRQPVLVAPPPVRRPPPPPPATGRARPRQ